MSMVDVHAILLLLFPVVAVVAIRLFGFAWTADGARLLSCIVVIVCWLLVATATMALTPWYPTWQWIIPGLCIVAIMLCVEDFSQAAWVALSIAVAGLGLILHAWHLCDHVRSSPAYPEWVQKSIDNHDLRLASEQLSRDAPELSSQAFPAGWLESVFPSVNLSPRLVGEATPKFVRCWHTGLTGILERDGNQSLGIWYPGGIIAQASPHLEIRDRTMSLK